MSQFDETDYDDEEMHDLFEDEEAMTPEEVFKMVKKSNNLNRLVTLSPLTQMARDFHLRNGAKELQVNKTSQNFEYTIENDWWKDYLEHAKKWFKLKR